MSGDVVRCAPGEGRTQCRDGRRQGVGPPWASGHWLRSIRFEFGSGIVYVVLVVLCRRKAQEDIPRMIKIRVSKKTYLVEEHQCNNEGNFKIRGTILSRLVPQSAVGRLAAS